MKHQRATLADIYTGDPLHSRAACTQPCNVNTHSRAHCSAGARLCEQWGHGCVNNGARLCASARLCRGSPVIYQLRGITTSTQELISPALISSSNDIIMGRMGICFTSVSTSWWGEACCLFMMTSSNGNIFRVTGHLCGALTFSLICARINGWVNNREAGDLRRHPTHCDVIVMYYASLWGFAYCVALSAVLNFDCLGDCSPFTSDLLTPTWLIIGIGNKAVISGGKI